MANTDDLTLTIEATHESFERRCEEVCSAEGSVAHAKADAFIATTGRHLAAMNQVLLPLLRRHVGDDEDLVQTYLQRARHLEKMLVRLKGRAYGESHTVHLSWSEVCAETRDALREHDESQRLVVDRLAGMLSTEELDDIAERVFRAEVRAPTRPHPYLPRQGVSGRVARRASAAVDRFWDTAQGRVVPPVIPPPAHTHESRLGQYLVADPLFDASAPTPAPAAPATEPREAD